MSNFPLKQKHVINFKVISLNISFIQKVTGRKLVIFFSGEIPGLQYQGYFFVGFWLWARFGAIFIVQGESTLCRLLFQWNDMGTRVSMEVIVTG